ncbi:hypothetical protein [Pseudomonas wadenswilerensis]|uniref:Uncharacterized protein n=1 Tax=Pseudomonas wadenswilerensis TaxID=1785161 RepID=A0A380T3F5_9PSED|nr:hypothetical protein [Pseudomonas wadenswilerensis]SUQ64769.1 hypothetical protein CCOS864_04235 [Pseudomonas wadenswilerensis]
MTNSARNWQLISLVLAIALTAALIALHHLTTTGRHTTDTIPTVDSFSDAPTLVLSPAARRAQERYSL